MTRVFWFLLGFALGAATIAALTAHLYGLTPQVGLGSSSFPF